METLYLMGLVITKIVVFIAICFISGAISRLFKKHNRQTLLQSALSPVAIAPAVIITVLLSMAEFSAIAQASQNTQTIRLDVICAEKMQVSGADALMCRSMAGEQGAEQAPVIIDNRHECGGGDVTERCV